MPSLKRETSSAPERTGFELYDGPEPKAGMYPGVIKGVTLRNSKSSSNQYWNVLVEMVTTHKPGKEQYNGYPAWVMIVMTDKEGNISREQAFYKAVCGKMDVSVVFNALDAADNPGKVTKIGGVDPVGRPVKVQMNNDRDQSGDPTVKGDSIYMVSDEEGKAILSAYNGGASGFKGAGGPAPDFVPEDDGEIETEDAVEEDGDDEEVAEREAELKGMTLPNLRKLAAGDYEIDTKGLNKEALVEAILDHEYPEDDEEAEDEELEVDEDSDEEEEEEAEEEDEEEEDEEGALRDELAGLDRNALKKRLKSSDAAAKILTKDTDDDLRDKIVTAELGNEADPPF